MKSLLYLNKITNEFIVALITETVREHRIFLARSAMFTKVSRHYSIDM